ncbi:MAG: AMP-binding protein, partial [Actinomycetota bacterium]
DRLLQRLLEHGLNPERDLPVFLRTAGLKDSDRVRHVRGSVAEVQRLSRAWVDKGCRSGATGPAKGVRYTHGQLTAQRDALAGTYAITGDDRLVAAFAPFSLYGPALGIPTALPDCDVTAPGSLTHEAVAAAVDSVDATLVFASPTAIRNVVETAGAGDRSAAADALSGVRTLMSAGAPIPAELLDAASKLVPNAEIHTPYGMTETLPVADIELGTIRAADADDPVGGVCVGVPVAGVDVRIVPIDFDALAGVPDGLRTGELGEVLVRAPWTSAGYDRLWDTERRARPGAGWHRTGDVGHLDEAGRLWIGGRSVHVIHAVDGPVASVPVERVVERSDVPGVVAGRVAALGVGPVGIQQLVIVLERPDGDDAPLAALSVADRVRRAVRAGLGLDVAAVLTRDTLPVDIRHEAKIDRTALASWASEVLAGEAVER